jgi:hypothetical protein
MKEFSAATDGKTVTVMSAATGYAVERPFTEVPAKVRRELDLTFNLRPGKPHWSGRGVKLAADSELYLWYLFEKAQDKYEDSQEPFIEDLRIVPKIIHGMESLEAAIREFHANHAIFS